MNRIQANSRTRCGVKRDYRIALAMVFAVLTNTMGLNASATDSQMEGKEYQKDVSRIVSVVESKDLKKIDQIGIGLHAKWQGKDKQQHADLMLKLCVPLRSTSIKDFSKQELARKYALWGLSTPDQISLETEERLVGYVMTDMVSPFAPTGLDWAKKRSEDVKAWLHAWRRLSDAIDPTWDPKDLPQANVAPPAATGLPAGVGSEAINDPALRRKYEAAITENNRKAERYRTQYQLRQQLKDFSPWPEKYIVEAYSKAPFDLKELDQLLGAYLKDDNTRARILDSVRTKKGGK